MLRWSHVSIRWKLPFAFAAVVAFTVGILVAGASVVNYRAQISLIENSFRALGRDRHDLVHAWLEKVQSAMLSAVSAPLATDAIYRLGGAFSEVEGDAKAVLQDQYIAKNPNPTGEKSKLLRGDGPEAYNAEHAIFHGAFRTIVERHGFYDLFLINRNGDIVYTVFKETDFGASVSKGALAQSGLAKVFNQAFQATEGEVFFSNFEAYAPSGGLPSIFMATPIVSLTGQNVGVMAVQLPQDQLFKIIESSNEIGASTEIILANPDHRAMNDSRFEGHFQIGAPLKETAQLKAITSGQEVFFGNTGLQSGANGFAQTFLIEKPGDPWMMIIERDRSDVLAPFYASLKMQLLLGGISFFLCVGAGAMFSSRFAAPITALSTSIQKVADGDYTLQDNAPLRGDEIGEIESSLAGLRLALRLAADERQAQTASQAEQSRVVQTLLVHLRDMAEGDLSKSIDTPFSAEYEDLRHYMNETVTSIGDAISQILVAADTIRAQSSEITRASEDLSHRTEVQAATLEQTAAAMDQMTSSVKSATEGVLEVEDIVRAARRDADQSGVVVSEAVSAMAEIEKSSNQISLIIGVIDDIAFQTNLLALNAGVEAARAGDAGRGFAVVASEVGALAQRASSAAKEIKELIGTSSQHVERGVDRVKQAGETLHQIAQRVTHISTLTSNISTGASEQSIGLNEINVGVTQLDQATQKNAAMAEEATAASHLLQSGAMELAELVARFKLRSTSPAPHYVPPPLPVFHPEPALQSAPYEEDVSPPMAVAAGGRGVWQDF